jgi:DBF zinc finger
MAASPPIIRRRGHNMAALAKLTSRNANKERSKSRARQSLGKSRARSTSTKYSQSTTVAAATGTSIRSRHSTSHNKVTDNTTTAATAVTTPAAVSANGDRNSAHSTKVWLSYRAVPDLPRKSRSWWRGQRVLLDMGATSIEDSNVRAFLNKLGAKVVVNSTVDDNVDVFVTDATSIHNAMRTGPHDSTFPNIPNTSGRKKKFGNRFRSAAMRQSAATGAATGATAMHQNACCQAIDKRIPVVTFPVLRTVFGNMRPISSSSAMSSGYPYMVRISDPTGQYSSRDSVLKSSDIPRLTLDKGPKFSPWGVESSAYQAPASDEPTENILCREKERRLKLRNWKQMGNKHGRCECCEERYDDLTLHLKTTKHRMYAATESNYKEVDQCFAALASRNVAVHAVEAVQHEKTRHVDNIESSRPAKPQVVAEVVAGIEVNMDMDVEMETKAQLKDEIDIDIEVEVEVADATVDVGENAGQDAGVDAGDDDKDESERERNHVQADDSEAEVKAIIQDTERDICMSEQNKTDWAPGTGPCRDDEESDITAAVTHPVTKRRKLHPCVSSDDAAVAPVEATQASTTVSSGFSLPLADAVLVTANEKVNRETIALAGSDAGSDPEIASAALSSQVVSENQIASDSSSDESHEDSSDVSEQHEELVVDDDEEEEIEDGVDEDDADEEDVDDDDDDDDADEDDADEDDADEHDSDGHNMMDHCVSVADVVAHDDDDDDDDDDDVSSGDSDDSDEIVEETHDQLMVASELEKEDDILSSAVVDADVDTAAANGLGFDDSLLNPGPMNLGDMLSSDIEEMPSQLADIIGGRTALNAEHSDTSVVASMETEENRDDDDDDDDGDDDDDNDDAAVAIANDSCTKQNDDDSSDGAADDNDDDDDDDGDDHAADGNDINDVPAGSSQDDSKMGTPLDLSKFSKLPASKHRTALALGTHVAVKLDDGMYEAVILQLLQQNPNTKSPQKRSRRLRTFWGYNVDWVDAGNPQRPCAIEKAAISMVCDVKVDDGSYSEHSVANNAVTEKESEKPPSRTSPPHFTRRQSRSQRRRKSRVIDDDSNSSMNEFTAEIIGIANPVPDDVHFDSHHDTVMEPAHTEASPRTRPRTRSTKSSTRSSEIASRKALPRDIAKMQSHAQYAKGELVWFLAKTPSSTSKIHAGPQVHRRNHRRRRTRASQSLSQSDDTNADWPEFEDADTNTSAGIIARTRKAATIINHGMRKTEFGDISGATGGLHHSYLIRCDDRGDEQSAAFWVDSNCLAKRTCHTDSTGTGTGTVTAPATTPATTTAPATTATTTTTTTTTTVAAGRSRTPNRKSRSANKRRRGQG